MAMVINSNIQSLNAQRHLNNSLEAQNTATERLSSGKRINSAKDDAAGLAIANRMTSQVKGLDQAIRNANDGAALIQTAEGGLEETTNILQRMRELSIQSANGTYDTGNRDTLNAEVEQLQKEIDRISETTSFNGLNILDGTLGEVDLQVGENANQTIALNIDSLNTKNLGDDGADLIGATSSAASLLEALQAVTSSGAGSITVNGDAVQALSTSASLDEAVGRLNDSVAGVEVSKFVELAADNDVINGGNGALSGDDELIITVGASNSTSGAQDVINIKDTANMEELVAKINAEGGDTVSASINDDGDLVLYSETGTDIAVTGNGDGLVNAGFDSAGVTQQAQLKFEITDSSISHVSIEGSTASTTGAVLNGLGINEIDSTGKVTSTSSGAGGQLNADELVLNGVSIEAGTGASLADTAAAINRQSDATGVVAQADTGAGTISLISTEEGRGIKIESGEGFSNATEEARDDALYAKLGLRVRNETDNGTATVASIDISTAAGAQRAIGILDEAISQVSETRGELGAISNRLDHTTRNLSNISENASAARSQIMDADFAAESANLSRAQVLQQAGNAMLAQANSRPQQVLSLLQ